MINPRRRGVFSSFCFDVKKLSVVMAVKALARRENQFSLSVDSIDNRGILQVSVRECVVEQFATAGKLGKTASSIS